MTDLKTLYEDDTVAWAENQATALRAAAHGGSNQELDWQNLAEEIEDLSKSIKRGVHSQVRKVIEHLIKLEYSPAQRPRNSWLESIAYARVEIDAALEESPSLKPQLEQIIREEIPRAARPAISRLERRGEVPDRLGTTLKTKSYLDLFSYTPEQILGDWFPPEPKG
ncbi:MAG TPA: DUF29 domain-containing protein [Stellaceae bacterium]|nr:DUF29 domain-containing protein [Stellaceae bacterium]